MIINDLYNNKKQDVAEGGIATVGWPDEDNRTGSNPPVSVGGTFDARPVVKRGSLVKASGLTGVYRVMDILRDEAKIVQEIPRTGVSTYVPMSDLRVWTNKPVKEQGVAEGRFVRGPGGVPLDRQGRPVAPKAPKAEPMTMRQWVVHHEGQRGEGGEMIIDAPNLETAWELANEYDLDIIDIKPAKGVAEGSKMARADKSAKAPKPKDQQEYDDVEKYRKDLAQSYNKEPNFGIKDDEEENKWWIDYDLDEGVAEGSLEEVSQQTLQSYRKKASAQKRAADDVVSGDADDETWKKNVSLSAKRRQGIDAANKRLGVAEGFSLKKTNVDKYMEPGDPDEYTQDVNIKDTDYEIINNKTGQVVGTASWTTNDFMGPGALKITMKNGATRWLDIWASEQGNPQSAFNRFVKDPKTAKKYKEQGMAEASLGDYRKKAAVSQAGAKIDRFFGRDDPAKVAAADQTIAKRERGLARADARTKPYTPPPAAPVDLEKQQRDLTAKYPNIDELVRRAELNRDPDYEMADGQAYYAARDAEQNYQKLRQIQRVIQGLNESLQRTQP